MKKMSYLGIIALCAIFAVSCSSSSTSNTPSDAAKQCVEYLSKGDYQKFVDYMAKDEAISDQMNEAKKKFALLMVENQWKKMLNDKKGIKNVEVLSENISEDGNSATVNLKVTFGDEKSMEETYSMVKQNDEWKFIVPSNF